MLDFFATCAATLAYTTVIVTFVVAVVIHVAKVFNRYRDNRLGDFAVDHDNEIAAGLWALTALAIGFGALSLFLQEETILVYICGAGVFICVLLSAREIHKSKDSPYQQNKRQEYEKAVRSRQADDDEGWKPES